MLWHLRLLTTVRITLTTLLKPLAKRFPVHLQGPLLGPPLRSSRLTSSRLSFPFTPSSTLRCEECSFREYYHKQCCSRFLTLHYKPNTRQVILSSAWSKQSLSAQCLCVFGGGAWFRSQDRLFQREECSIRMGCVAPLLPQALLCGPPVARPDGAPRFGTTSPH
jgi:hypothetical protein